MSNCLFCKIIAGEIPSKQVYQDDHVVAFHDINPQAPSHIVVIPKLHIDDIRAAREQDGEMLGRLMLAAARIAEGAGLAQSGFRVVVNAGPDAGQSVDHLHVHVLGGRRMAWPPG